ncbi:BQ5605_C001g00811 [Microbotryum silenes-dioicae]|uniref:BQ5605_C001g00811 protein n=1 Tax=Microbotryum silenes-dioicae TaxID=796604 RepID=A0A2X0P0U5_9BASI|nr:BQ5605_C001g00811 [Microbotryum silenes-dioicae]
MSRIDKGVHIFYRRVKGGSPILSFYGRKEQYPVLAPSPGRYDEKRGVTYHCEGLDRSPSVREMRIAEVIGLS